MFGYFAFRSFRQTEYRSLKKVDASVQVDRSVTGLVAQQQTVGPLQLPLADVAVIAQTHVGTTGGACAIGEQPLKVRG